MREVINRVAVGALAVIMGLALALAACGGKGEGEKCSSTDECSGNLVCGVWGECGRSCVVDADCKGGEVCRVIYCVTVPCPPAICVRES
jgi:hypothetical protein